MSTPPWVTITLWIHLASALTTLGSGPLAMITRKGGRNHRLAGKVFFWGMFGIFSSGLVMLLHRFNFFLLIITILSFYGALTGYRVLYRKTAVSPANLLDKTSAWLALAAGSGFIGWGAVSLLGIMATGMPPVFAGLGIGFGFIIANMARMDLVSFKRPSTDKRWWWYYHMDRMLSAYMATVTALAVQTAGYILPDQLQWLAWVTPGLVGTPLISYWISRYRRQFGDVQQKTAVASGD